MTKDDYANVSDQYKSRGWDIYSVEQLRYSHFLDYGSNTILTKLRSSYLALETTLKNILNESFDYQDLNLYYPEMNLSNDADVVSHASQYRDLYELYSIVNGWGDLFSALDIPIWKNGERCTINTPVEAECGRESKVNYVLQTLPAARRTKLETLRRSLNSEINFAKRSGMKVAIDDKVFNLFQFLNDETFIGNIISADFFNGSSVSTEREKLFVEGMRAIILQVFKEAGGRVITSDSLLVNLEPSSCNANCMYLHYKQLMYSEGEVASNVVTNLIFDKKMIRPLAKYYLSLKSENLRTEFESNVKRFLLEVIGLDVADEELSDDEKQKITYFLTNGVDYLLKNPSVDSLKLAKKIEYYLKDLNNE